MSSLAAPVNPNSKQVTLMIMRFPLLLLTILALVLTACGEVNRSAGPSKDVLQEVTARKVIRVGVMPNTQPFSYQVGSSWTGFDIEIAQGVANHLGIENVEFVPVNLDQRSDAVINGTVDMIVASMTITRYRERRVDFSIPYFQDGLALLVKSSSPINSYIDLDKKKIGATKGSTSSFYMKQINPDAVVKTYADNAAMHSALDAASAPT